MRAKKGHSEHPTTLPQSGEVAPRTTVPVRATSTPPLLRWLIPLPPSLLRSPPPFSLSSGSLQLPLSGLCRSETTPSPSRSFSDAPLRWLKDLSLTTFQATIVSRLHELPQHLVFQESPTSPPAPRRASSSPAFPSVSFLAILLPTLEASLNHRPPSYGRARLSPCLPRPRK